jgi:hypothetical protein
MSTSRDHDVTNNMTLFAICAELSLVFEIGCNSFGNTDICSACYSFVLHFLGISVTSLRCWKAGPLFIIFNLFLYIFLIVYFVIYLKIRTIFGIRANRIKLSTYKK